MAQVGPQEPGSQGPREAYKGLAHEGPVVPTRARPIRAQGGPLSPGRVLPVEMHRGSIWVLQEPEMHTVHFGTGRGITQLREGDVPYAVTELKLYKHAFGYVPKCSGTITAHTA